MHLVHRFALLRLTVLGAPAQADANGGYVEWEEFHKSGLSSYKKKAEITGKGRNAYSQTDHPNSKTEKLYPLCIRKIEKASPVRMMGREGRGSEGLGFR